ncbi:unnamed protein product, partial [Rotaria sordida]
MKIERDIDKILRPPFILPHPLIDILEITTTTNNIDFSDKSLVDTKQKNQILSLQEEIKCLEQQLKDNQYLIDSLKNNLQLITQENLQLTKQYNEIQQKNDLLIKDNHNLTNQLENRSIPLDSQQENVLQLSTDQIQHIHHSPIEEIPLNIIPHVQSSNVIQEIQQLKNNLATLTIQCTELDEANRAWQQYYQNQIELFHDKLQDWIPLDMNLTLEQIIHQIVSYLNQLEYDKNLSLQNNNPSDSTTTILSLQKQLAKYQNNESILAQNLEQLNQKLLDVYKQCEEFREHNAQLILSKQQVDKQLEEQEKQLVEFQLIIKNSEQNLDQQIDLSKENISVDNVNREQDEEINQLRTELYTLTNKCAELDEANHAWQQFQQAQLDNFRNKLRDHFSFDENLSFDQIAQLIINQIIKEREDFNQQYEILQKTNDELRSESEINLETIKESYINTINELNQELLIIKEELEKQTNTLNQQQLIELPERSLDEIPVDRTTQYTEKEILSTDENNLALEQVLIEILRNELENYLSIDYNVSFNKIVEQIRKERENFNERYQTLEKTTHHLQLEFENNMESIRQSYINTVNELNQELLVMKEQCEKFHQINKELVIENENLNNQLNDRSIVVGHHSATETSFIEQQNLIDNNEQSPLQSTNISNENLFETLDKYTQYEQKDSNHIATETISLTYKHHQTQIDPIDINHQQSQTESFHQLWPSSDDENNDQLNEYINELSSQSSIDISNNLNRECQQILSQQNLKLTSISNLELNHLALITIYFLYHQHLSDIAKELYNETFIRALQEEYNLLNNEKNDLIEHINSIQEKFQQIEDERLYSQEIIRNLNEKLNEKNYEQLEKQYNDLINENQLLKDYNALIYHDKLQEKIENDSIEIKSLHDVDIQCDLNDEIQLLNTKKSNLNNNLNEDSTIQQISNKQEIIRLKTIIEEIEIENKYLKDLYLKLYNSINNQSHDTDIQSSLRLTSIDNSVKTDIDNQQHDKIQTTEQIEENDWNDQISSLEFPLEESNITQENFIKQMIDNETQTDDQKYDKLIQINNKLKRALQTIKEKIHHIVVEQPELFRDSTDDTIERLDHLISAIGHQAAQIDHLKSEPFIPPSILSEQEIKQLIDKRNQLQEDKLNNNQEIHNLKCQLTKYKQQIQSSSQINQLINNETQTDDQQHDKLIQVNNKLKRALQTIKEKIHQVVIARPELFQDLTDDTIERLNHLISTIEHQTAQINSLQTEYDDKQNEINELQSSLESYQYQIQNNLSEKDQEKSLLQEHLNEIELQFKKTLNDHSLIMIKFELLSRERDVLIEQQTLQSIEHQQEIEQLQDELIQLKQTYIPLNEEMELLKEIIEQHSEKLTDLNEKNLILDAQKKKIEQQTNELENLRQEHTKLLELISIEKINNQTQTDDRQHEKLLQINNKLKRIIQIFKEKIHRLVIEKPNLFDGISEETNERLNHLISIVENQTIQLDLIQNERDALEKQLRNEIKELERSLETSENELNYEKQVRSAQLVSAAPSEDTSSSIVEDYQKQIDKLEQKLSENNEEQSLLREHLNKVEVELKETKHNHALTL